MADDDTAPEGAQDDEAAAEAGQLDLAEIRVETLMLQVASELMSIGAGQLGLIPEMVNGGDAFQASLAIGGADALIETFVAALPPGTEVPGPVDELRRALAELKLAFAEAIRQSAEAAGVDLGAAGGPPPAAEAPKGPADSGIERPTIWTPGGER